MAKTISIQPSLRQLGYLLALHQHQHFGRAAAASFVTQSTLSVGIAELERQLGVLLVERTKRRVRFTPVGEDVVLRARDVARAVEDLCAAAQSASEPLAGRVALAAIPTIAPFVLPGILTGVAAKWPRLELFVREMLTGAACEAMQRGTIDCVLLALPVECGDVESCEILIDPLRLAVGDGDVPTPASDIDPDRLLFLEGGHCLTDHALAACGRADPPPEARLVASTVHTLVQLVEAGHGVTLLPEIAIQAGILAGTGVTSHALTGGIAERRIALVWRRGHPRGADFRLLGETVRERCGLNRPATTGKFSGGGKG